mgnify:CR=1 FL=1
MKNELISIITPTYNREKTLIRVYDSLCKQSYKNIEWIVVDDGSSDKTKELILSLINQKDAPFPIKYVYQKNSGKHIAVNKGLELAGGGGYVGILDSDDALFANALEILIGYWNTMTPQEKKEFKSVTGRVANAETGELIGPKNKFKSIDCSSIEARFVRKMGYEKWALSRTDVMREFKSPNIEGLHFYPENIVYDAIGRKYKERFVEDVVRKYYLDSSDSIIKNKKGRSKENYYLWLHNVNDVFDYFLYNPIIFVKSFVGLARDGMLSGRGLMNIMKQINTFPKRLLFIIFMPVGMFLAYKR